MRYFLFKHRVLALMLASGPWLPAMETISESFDSFEISCRFLPNLSGAWGYVTLEMEFASKTPSALELELRMHNLGSRRSWRVSQDISKRIRLEPGGRALVRVRTWSRLPTPDMLYIRIIRGGPREIHEVTLPAPTDYWPRHYQGGPNNVLTSTEIGGDFISWSVAALEPNPDFWLGPPGGSGRSFEKDLFRATSESVSNWGGSWLDFSPFQMVVLTAEEWESLPRPKRTALESYIECGGVLLLQGSSFLPSGTWRPRGVSVDGVSSFHSGFGVIHATQADLETLEAPQWAEIWRAPFETSQLLDTNPQIMNLHKRLPVVSHLRIPVKRFFFLMLVFVIVMGPINMVMLAKKNRRIWILLTVPLISIIGTLAVLCFALFTEGIGISLRQEGVTLLDESRKRAVSLGFHAIHSPLSLGRAMRFSATTEISPLLDQSSVHPLSADWTEGQDLGSGWVLSRVPFYYKTRSNELRRERLGVQALDSDRLEVTNGLGASIERLYLTDAEGTLYHADSIPAGGKGVAERMGGVQQEGANVWRSLFNSDWRLESGGVQALLNRPGLLHPHENAYLALLDGAPFHEQPLPKVANYRGRTLVYGLRGREP